MRRNKLIFASVLVAFAFLSGAKAATIFQTATIGTIDNGGYYIDNQPTIIGAAFTLTQATNISAIGATFDNPDGTIFGAIVSLPSITSLPTLLDVQTNSLGYTTFSLALAQNPNVSGTETNFGDYSASLPLTLGPGTYGVVFGSGLFGADGSAGLAGSNDTVGSPNVYRYFFGDWSNFGYDSQIRIFVDGTAVASVPEPSTWAMMLLGFLSLALASRHAASRLRTDRRQLCAATAEL